MFFNPVIFLSSLCLTAYFYVQTVRKSFVVVLNDNMYIPSFLSFLLKTPFIDFFFILTMLILVCSVIFNGRYIRYLSYIISLMVLNMAWYVTMDMLMLKNMTTYFLIKIYHPIPLEVKINYLASYIGLLFENAKLPLDAQYTSENILNKSSIKSMLPLMDAEAIQKYSRDVIYATGYEYDMTPNFPGIATFMTMVVFTCMIDYSVTTTISLITSFIESIRS